MRALRMMGRWSSGQRGTLLGVAVLWMATAWTPSAFGLYVMSNEKVTFQVTPSVNLSNVQLLILGTDSFGVTTTSAQVATAGQTTPYTASIDLPAGDSLTAFGFLATTNDGTSDHLVVALDPSVTPSSFSTLFPGEDEATIISGLKAFTPQWAFFKANSPLQAVSTALPNSTFKVDNATLYEFSDPNPVGSLSILAQPIAVPEPASILLLGVPVVVGGVWSIRRRRAG